MKLSLFPRDHLETLNSKANISEDKELPIIVIQMGDAISNA